MDYRVCINTKSFHGIQSVYENKSMDEGVYTMDCRLCIKTNSFQGLF